MMTYTEIVDDIYQYYGTCFLNDLEDTTIRNYEDFVETVIEENFNSAMTYSVAFERTYDYRDVNMPATIQMMNYILDDYPEDYTILSKGAQAVISMFAIVLIRNAIHEEMNYEAEFKEHWRRVDEESDEEPEDPNYNIDNACVIIEVRVQDGIMRGITCKHCGFELPEMLRSEHMDPHNPKNNCLCTDDDKKKYRLNV